MNRLQKKCFIVSAGTHLLLALILLVGPAFLSAKNTKSESLELLDFIPPRTVDALVAPNPGGAPAQRQQQQQPAAAQPPSVPESKPPPAPLPKEQDTPKVVDKQNTESLEFKPHKPHLPEVNTTVKVRRPTGREKPAEKSDNRERQAADDRRRTVAALANAAARLNNGLSGSTSIRIGDGDGRGTGAAYANFLQALKTVYTEAWNVPDGADDDATVSTSVTIARDGTVVSAHIIRRSGNSFADNSVQLTLDRVRHAVPLPEDSKESQRTVTITFSVRAKRLLG